MSRVIKLESAGKDRTQLSKAIVVALRELMKLDEPGLEAKDLSAFIAISLEEIFSTVDESVAAWEKRGYWVKADRFRLEWEWTKKSSSDMKHALRNEDWAVIATLAAFTGQKFSKVKVGTRNRIGTPWKDAYHRMK